MNVGHPSEEIILALMGLRPTQGDEKRLRFPSSVTTLNGAPSSLCYPDRARISCHASPDKTAYAPFRKAHEVDNAIKFHRKSGGA
jgi:hypothetical protein